MVAKMTVDDVAAWLRELQYKENVIEKFVENEIDGSLLVMEDNGLDEKGLKEHLGIKQFGVIKKLPVQIRALDSNNNDRCTKLSALPTFRYFIDLDTCPFPSIGVDEFIEDIKKCAARAVNCDGKASPHEGFYFTQCDERESFHKTMGIGDFRALYAGKKEGGGHHKLRDILSALTRATDMMTNSTVVVIVTSDSGMSEALRDCAKLFPHTVLLYRGPAPVGLMDIIGTEKCVDIGINPYAKEDPDSDLLDVCESPPETPPVCVNRPPTHSPISTPDVSPGTTPRSQSECRTPVRETCVRPLATPPRPAITLLPSAVPRSEWAKVAATKVVRVLETTQRVQAPAEKKPTAAVPVEKQGKNRKTVICDKWRRRTCENSKKDCEFAHGDDDLRKVDVLCTNHAGGSCTKGKACPYAHSLEKLSDDKIKNYKTTMCKDAGNCPRGKACLFAHEPEEMPAHVQNKYKIHLCKAHWEGVCGYGTRCNNAHGTADQRVARPTPGQCHPYPCTRFAEDGFCKLGKACLFEH